MDSVPRFLLDRGSTSSSSKDMDSMLSSMSDVDDSCSRDLNISIYQGLVFESVGDAVVGALVLNEIVGDIVGASVLAQMGSLPSINSGG